MVGSQSRTSAAVAAAATLLLALSACGGGGSAQAQPSTASSAGTDNASAVVNEMKELIQANTAQPQFKDPGPAVAATQLAGKTIAIVAIDLRVPALAEVADYVKQVSSQLGIKTTLYDAKSSASGMQQGMQQAINNGADAIISDGLVIQLITKQIKDAKDKGIPTIDVVNTPPVRDVAGQGSDPNIFGNVAPDTFLAGQLMAATAVTRTNGKAKVAIMNTSELTVAPTMIKGMKDVLDKCSDCSVTENDTALGDWSTALTGKAATTIRSNPDLNFLLPLYDAMGIFATSGVQQAGASGRVHIASFNGTAAALALVKKGDVFVADPAQNNEWAAWAAVDQALRGMLKMQPADPVLPIRYVDSELLKDVDVSTPQAVYKALFGDGYKTGYLKLWGVS
jgi:ribose transport system substrate-binding protein